MMEQQRRTDSEPTRHFRSDRFFIVSGSWYFTTRESEDFGPFDNREEADTKLTQYLDTQSIMKRLRDNDPTLEDNREQDRMKIAQLSSDIQKERH